MCSPWSYFFALLSYLRVCASRSLCSHRLLGLSTRLSLPVSLSLSIIHLIKGRDIDGGRGGGGASEGSDDRSEEEGEEGERGDIDVRRPGT